MSGTMTIATAVDRIERLIPTYRSPILVGQGVWVLTYPESLPERFREAQAQRTRRYLSTRDHDPRSRPDDALRYLVTSYGVPVAWVTLDGRTHYATLVPSGRNRHTGALTDTPRDRAIHRHQQAVRAVWPERFGINADGEPCASVPGGFRLDADGELHPQS